ncbi:MAG: 50S ribosomal protein L17 [Clostridiales bacterium]|jgi:large subunit ribosomal protein L17|nr:50S ribosomal protein L17 [Clostridiales bacterium]
MAKNRKLGRTSSQRKAMLRNLATNLLYHGRIKTTDTRAKEVRKVAERLITLAVREMDNFTEVTKSFKVPQKDASGRRIKEEQDGKRVTVFDTVERTVRVDNPSRLSARRKMLSVLYPVTEVPADGRKKRALSKSVNMPEKLFNEIAPRYADRQGGYTRIIKLGKRKGDGAEEVYIELV